MIDLTKIKKFPVIGFTERNAMYFIHDYVMLDKNKVYSCSRTSSIPSGFIYYVNSHGELTCPEGTSITSNEGSLNIVGLLAFQEELQATEKELEATKKELQETKIDRNYFQGELKEAIKQRNGIDSYHGVTLMRLQATEKELEETKEQNDYLIEQLHKVNNELNERDKSFSIILNQKRNAVFEIDSLKKGTVFKLEQDNIVLYNELNRTKRLLELEKNDSKTKENQLKKLQDSYSSLFRELEATKQELGQLKIEYTLTCKKTTRIFDDQIKREVDLNNLVTHLKSAIEVLTKELSATKIKLHEATINRDHFYSTLKELEETKKELECTKECLKMANTTINNTLRENDKVTAKLIATYQELKGTKISREAASSKVEELLREKVLLEEKIYRILKG